MYLFRMSEQPTPESNLALPNRKIWVVTTASLPWRTGTSINPLLRALYLTRGRPSKSVCLVVPWLPSKNDRDLLYGKAAKDWPQDSGLSCQEECIRNFALDECGMAEEWNALQILFYRAAYVQSFGSIFPTEDICAIIPDEDADVAILEEPEHLNWFRMPSLSEDTEESLVSGTSSVIRCPNPSNDAVVKEEMDVEFSKSFERCCQQTEEVEEDEKKKDEADETVCSGANGDSNYRLGWAHKFRFVVGICHTNYAAYVKRYGIGASVIAAPAITAFNALVVRAYCNRVIKLSDTLQEFIADKEVTCNVHGVRPDFLMPSTKDQIDNEVSPIGDSGIPYIYFIGKLLWAKGFDDMLEIQDRYRRRTGHFFPIHVYGSGPDENAIRRAFFGRQMAPVYENNKVSPGGGESECVPPTVETVFSNPTSLRSQSIELLKKEEEERNVRDEVHSLGFEVTTEGFDDTLCSIEYVEEAAEDTKDERLKNSASPLHIIGDISTSSVSTGFATSVAAYKVGDVAVKNILSLVFAPELNTESQSDESSRFVFDPPQSRYELRRHPVPATFLGVKDHALVKSTSLKIFLNPSVSEVLCTTTAEALAMGKFVVIPRHPSNNFFEQFPNALLYNSLDDAVDKILFAVDNNPTPLNAAFSKMLSWEAATERLIKASIVTLGKEDESTISARRKKDLQIAWLHSEASKTTHFLGTILPTGTKSKFNNY